MTRKLASVQRVLALESIPNADRIEVAQINGWRCIVKKGEFKVGHVGVFLEIDAVPPDHAAFDWLWQKDGQPKLSRPLNFRIRTKKLRGVLSQGLLLPIGGYEAGDLNVPLCTLMKLCDENGNPTGVSTGEGMDVTELLGVEKYEAPPPRSQGGHNTSKRVSDFPTHLVPKTDEERVQSCTKVLFELAGKPFIATMKCDGQSATYVYDAEKDDVLVCSRNFVISKDPMVRPAQETRAWLAEATLANGLTFVRADGGVTPDVQLACKSDSKEECEAFIEAKGVLGFAAVEHVFVTPEKAFTNCWVEVCKKYGLQDHLKTSQFRDLAIQGEMVGPNSQGNPLGLPEDDIRVFSIFNTVTRQYLTFAEMAKVCGQLGLPMVPILYSGDSFYPELLDAPPLPPPFGFDEGGRPHYRRNPIPEACEKCAGCPECLTYESDPDVKAARGRAVTTVVEDLLKKAEGKYPGTKNEREGLVIRPRDEEMWSDALQGRLSFKAISNKYLLNEKD